MQDHLGFAPRLYFKFKLQDIWNTGMLVGDIPAGKLQETHRLT